MSDHRPPGDPRFLSLLDEMRALHLAKNGAYGLPADPLANLHGAAKMGVPPFRYAMARLNEKVERLQAFVQNGYRECESITDTLMDLSAFALLGLILYREEADAESALQESRGTSP